MAETREQRHKIEVRASPETLFRLLHTPSAIRQWWGVSRAIIVPEKEGVWVAAWGENEDEPDYVTLGTITAFEPPHRFALRYDRYFAKAGALPFKADFAVEFLVERRSGASARLQVTQAGFPLGPEADPFYAAVDQGWNITLQAIKTFAET